MKANIALSAFMAASIGHSDADVHNFVNEVREIVSAHDEFIHDFERAIGTDEYEFVEFYEECFSDDFEFAEL